MNKNLIVEEVYTLKPICEEIEGKKQWFLEGVFAQAEVVNKNGRFYAESTLDAAINEFKDEFMSKDRGVGELNHPPRIAVDPDRISHKVISLIKEGKDWRGKAVVLNTPTGKTIQGLLEGGVRVGVSTRGYGTMNEDKNGIKIVQPDFRIVAVDCVFHPSAPDALVTAIMEGQEWMWDRSEADVKFVDSIREDIQKSNLKMLSEAKLEAFKKFMSHF